MYERPPLNLGQLQNWNPRDQRPNSQCFLILTYSSHMVLKIFLRLLFIIELGHKILQWSDDDCETYFVFQRLSMIIQ